MFCGIPWGVKGARHIDGSLTVAFRDTVLDARRLKRIREFVETQHGWTRQGLAREVCRRFGWRRPNGAWAIRSARDLLVRLDQMGIIELPAARRAQGRPGREAIERAALDLSCGNAEEEPKPAGTHDASVVLLVRPIRAEERLVWRAHMERFHYLGDAELVGESLRYVALVDGELAGLVSWAAAARCNAARDRYVGWDQQGRRANLHLVVNNSRFLLLGWTRRLPHLASRVLGANLRRLSRDWEEAYGHRVVLAESFVDRARFRGTCYRASNWICVGETKGWAKRGARYRFHGEAKSVWLYPLRRDFKDQLCTLASTKKEGWMRVEVEALPLQGHGGLFDILCEVPDPRNARGVRYQIQGIVATALCAVLAGARSITAMAEWAAEQSPQTLRRLGSKYGRPPSERTYRRTFAIIDVKELDRRTGGWMAAQQHSLAATALAMDGKTVRGSGDRDKGALHLLSAIVHGSGVVVAQVAVEAKTNEITQVEPLFEERNIQGAVVTADALLTQKRIADHLVEEKKADYVFTVKDNQPTLKRDIAILGLEAFPPSAPNRR